MTLDKELAPTKNGSADCESKPGDARESKKASLTPTGTSDRDKVRC